MSFLAWETHSTCGFPGQENHSCDISTQKTHECSFLITSNVHQLIDLLMMPNISPTLLTVATEPRDDKFRLQVLADPADFGKLVTVSFVGFGTAFLASFPGDDTGFLPTGFEGDFDCVLLILSNY
jgi:hypothetical protein